MDTPLARKIRALIVEDERPARRFLAELLEDTEQVQVTAALASFEEAQQALDPDAGMRFDVAFVDVQLTPGGQLSDAGLRLVRRHVQHRAPKFVLATADPQHALEAYELGVFDYLLKPFSFPRVKTCVERLCAGLDLTQQAAKTERIVARSKNGLVFFDVSEVVAFQAEQRLVFVHTHSGKFDLDLSLSALKRLLGEGFIRVHRSWLVNRSMVRGLERTDGEAVLNVGSLKVPIPRERASELRRSLLQSAQGIKPLMPTE